MDRRLWTKDDIALLLKLRNGEEPTSYRLCASALNRSEGACRHMADKIAQKPRTFMAPIREPKRTMPKERYGGRTSIAYAQEVLDGRVGERFGSYTLDGRIITAQALVAAAEQHAQGVSA